MNNPEVLERETLIGSVLEIINNVDPQGLIRADAPLDEHMMEAQRIVKFVEANSNIHRDELVTEVTCIFDDVSRLSDKARQSTSLSRRIHRREYEKIAYQIHRTILDN